MAGTTALLASQINGGGCLPPPTPSASAGEMWRDTLQKFGNLGDTDNAGKDNFDKYSKELPPTLAFRCSTQLQMVQGVGGYVDPKNMTTPENPREMGFIMRNGRLTRMDRPRRNGDPAFWKTSSETAYDYLSDPQSLTINH